jgi:diacylglycerol kinase (ATP)
MRVSILSEPVVTATAAGRIAVIAHTGKTLGGGLDELRAALADAGATGVDWYEVRKSRKAPRKVAKALAKGAERFFIWGGDGMVQRCADALVGSDATVAIIPAGTANLLAHNLGIPQDLPEAVRIGVSGGRRRIDLGRFNGEHFAVMAGIGFDADMIRAADGGLKDRLGRLAYVWTGTREAGMKPVKMTVKVDGDTWFHGKATCVLVGNVGAVFGGVELFDGARPDDGRLDIGVSTAVGQLQWARVLGRATVGRSDQSPFVSVTQGKRISVKTRKPMTYELDGGARTKSRRAKVRVVPGGVTICVPPQT